MKNSSVKISDVSKLANVSVATVSRVINGNCFVKPETCTRVMNAIEQLNYQPNQSARNLRKNTSGTILVITPNLTNPYYSNILTGISETARILGYSTFICSTSNDQVLEQDFIKMLDTGRVDGAILMALNSDDTWILPYAKKYPIVLCSEYNPNLDIDHVCIDNYKAAFEACEYLISCNHKNIAMISSDNSYISTIHRMQGFKDALIKHNLKDSVNNIELASQDYSFESGKALSKKILSNKESKVTAIFCVSDILALGAIYGARECGLDVPNDVSILGFDNLEYTVMMVPQISTVNQPCYDIGVRAMNLMQAKFLCNTDWTTRHEILEHHIVQRDSIIKIK